MCPSVIPIILSFKTFILCFKYSWTPSSHFSGSFLANIFLIIPLYGTKSSCQNKFMLSFTYQLWPNLLPLLILIVITFSFISWHHTLLLYGILPQCIFMTCYIPWPCIGNIRELGGASPDVSIHSTRDLHQ